MHYKQWEWVQAPLPVRSLTLTLNCSIHPHREKRSTTKKSVGLKEPPHTCMFIWTVLHSELCWQSYHRQTSLLRPLVPSTPSSISLITQVWLVGFLSGGDEMESKDIGWIGEQSHRTSIMISPGLPQENLLPEKLSPPSAIKKTIQALLRGDTFKYCLIHLNKSITKRRYLFW